jgi:glycosyltransferase involved in cell wall biosynthesis
MNVALLNTNWYPQTGGGIVHVEELAKRLGRDHGCDVDILTQETSCDPVEGKSRFPDGVSLTQISGTDSRFRIANELRYTVGVLNHVRGSDYDIVHAHTNTATFPLQFLRFSDEVKTLLTVHGAHLDLSVTFTGSALDYVYTAVRRVILKHFDYDALISVSSELSDVLSPYHENVHFIPNGVNVEEFPEPGEYEEKSILFVGRLRPKKNPQDLVRAMTVVLDEHPDATLDIVGEGPLYDEIKQLTDQLSVSDNVIIHGFVDEQTLYDLYNRCSVFVLPSDWEGHPLVLMEAWASGQPVVGSNVEGIREFVSEGYGELVPLNDSEALGETLSELFVDMDALEELGVDARSFVESEYSWNTTVDQTYRLYRELLADGR